MTLTQQEQDALQWLEGLLCQDFSIYSGERTYGVRDGYRTVFTDIFTTIRSVKINGASVGYYKAFFNNRNGDFYNSVVLDECASGDVVIDANWGLTDLPADLQRLIDNAATTISTKYQARDVKSKRVEDFQITYGDLSNDEVFIQENATTISKYSLCNVGYVRHGSTEGDGCGNCI